MLNLERVGLIGCFFIPALWQGYTVEPTLFLSKPKDASGTNSLVLRVVDARTGVMRDAGVVPENTSPTKLAADVAAFVRQSRQNASVAKTRVYLAVGAFEDLSVNNRQADFPTQLRGYLTAAYRNGNVSLLEREYVDTLLQEVHLDMAGLTEESWSNSPPVMQSAYWLVSGQYQSYETANLQVELKLDVRRVFGRVWRRTLRDFPGEPVGRLVKSTLDELMNEDSVVFTPTRLSEAQLQMKIGKDVYGIYQSAALRSFPNGLDLVFVEQSWDQDPQLAIREKRNLQEAMRAFETVLLLEPTNRLAKMYLAACLRKPANHYPDKAREYYRGIINEPVQDNFSGLAQQALVATFENRWWKEPQAMPKAKWFNEAAMQTTNTLAADFYKKEAQAAEKEAIVDKGDSPEAEEIAEQNIYTTMQSFKNALQNKPGTLDAFMGMGDYAKLFGSDRKTAAQKLAALVPKMKSRDPDLEPFILAAAVTYQVDTNAPVIAEFEKKLNDCIEHPESVLQPVQLWTFVGSSVYGWCLEKTNNALAVALMEGERHVASVGSADWIRKVKFDDEGKIKLGYAYVATERWQDALSIFQSFSNQPVVMHGNGPWGRAFRPILTDKVADYCRQKIGLAQAQDSREFEMGKPLFCFCKPSAFAVVEDGLWIAIGGQLLHLDFDLKTNLVVNLPVDSDTPNSCLCVGSSAIWIGTYGAGLIEFDKTSHQMRRLTQKDGMTMDDVASLRLAENTLWIGYGKRTYVYYGQGESFGGGLGRLDLSSRQFTSFALSLSVGPEVHRQPSGNIVPEADDKPTRRPVIDIACVPSADVWFVAENNPPRLHRFQSRSNTWEASGWHCSSLASDGSRLVVGHYSNQSDRKKPGELGVSVLDLAQNQWRELKPIDELTPNGVSSLALVGHNLWAGGLGYIALVDLDHDKVLHFARIKASAVDRIQIGGGYVWAQFDWHLYRAPLSALQ